MPKSLRIVFGLIFFSATTLLVVFLVKTQFCAVHFINVSGATEYVSATDVYNFLTDNYGGISLFKVHPNKIQDRLLTTFLGIKSVRVRKLFPNTLDVHIAERSPLVIVCASNKRCYLVSQDGYVLGEVASTSSEFPSIQYAGDVLVGQFLSESFLDTYAKLLSQLAESSVHVNELNFYDSYAEFYTDRGVRVLLPFDKPLDHVLHTLETLLQILDHENKHPLVIDLRYDKVVVSY